MLITISSSNRYHLIGDIPRLFNFASPHCEQTLEPRLALLHWAKDERFHKIGTS